MVTDDIKNEILAVDEVTAVASYRYGALYEGINSGTKDLGNAPVYGVDKDYFRVMGYTVQTGRLFEDLDELYQGRNSGYRCSEYIVCK